MAKSLELNEKRAVKILKRNEFNLGLIPLAVVPTALIFGGILSVEGIFVGWSLTRSLAVLFFLGVSALAVLFTFYNLRLARLKEPAVRYLNRAQNRLKLVGLLLSELRRGK